MYNRTHPHPHLFSAPLPSATTAAATAAAPHPSYSPAEQIRRSARMAINLAAMSPSLRYCSAGAAVHRSAWLRSAGFLGRNNRTNRIGLKLSCLAPTAGSYAHDFDSDSETLPPGPWWGEALLDEDAEFFPLADFFPVGQGKKELDAIWQALVTAPLESVVVTLRDMVAAGNFFRCRSFHAGTLSGALLVVAGLCQLYKTTPTLFMDIALGYMFYKLSALSGQLQRWQVI
uniref:Uncharacterized protein n=1 Tax=Avena sativa TaxID=4498 RepID=A0ACD5UWG5_AVESA